MAEVLQARRYLAKKALDRHMLLSLMSLFCMGFVECFQGQEGLA